MVIHFEMKMRAEYTSSLVIFSIVSSAGVPQRTKTRVKWSTSKQHS